jgi:hypothetical protein
VIEKANSCGNVCGATPVERNGNPDVGFGRFPRMGSATFGHHIALGKGGSEDLFTLTIVYIYHCIYVASIERVPGGRKLDSRREMPKLLTRGVVLSFIGRAGMANIFILGVVGL